MTDMPAPAARPSRRRIALYVLGIVVVLALVGVAVDWLVSGQYRETSENAYVAANLVQVTPQVGGTAVAIHVNDTDRVAAGQVLVELDRTDARVALDSADAGLAKAVREVSALYAATDASRATLAEREAALARAREDLARRAPLAGSGAVSDEEVEHARAAVVAARQALEAARQQWQANRVATERTTLQSHPTVRQAATRVRDAYLAFARAVITAPLDGYVARRSVQLGQRVAPGAPLLTIVPLGALWVDANLKENQLRHVRIGQPVLLRADLYGGDIEYHGRVEGLAAGTGAVFSLLPAQNATGNWIKVVQRIPVRVALDPAEVAAHPLRVGLSMRVEVSTRDRSGSQLAAAPAARADASASQDPALAEADRRIARIIGANAPGR